MKIIFLLFSFLWFQQTSVAQKLLLPEPVTNCAAACLNVKKTDFVYTFYGLDSTKKWSGVHNKVFKINLTTGQTKYIGRVPDSLGRLAAAASTIKNKTYLTGGYAVYANGKEQSSGQLFIFDAATEKFTRGAALPLPIDDHIQAVWKDSLLYIISGWNDSVNVHAIQVYDAAADKWQLATPLPNEKTAAVFGGCGTILGDTIYMLGGAVFDQFYPPSRSFYKGIINPHNPLQINWMNAGEYPGEFRYRSGAYSVGNKIYFTGGSNNTYNYNAISYKEKKPVDPNTTVLIYNILTGNFYTALDKNSVMDIRNIISCGKNKFYIAGGIKAGQKLSGAVIRLKTDW
jgi:hypothetical protein